MKLQDAFVSESGTNYGSWKMIGYTMKTNNNVFTYDSVSTSYTGGTAVLGNATAVWKATPKANLNECSTSNFWQLKIKKATGTGNNGAEYEAQVSGGAGGNCDVLAPGFGKLGTGGVVSDAS